MSSISFLNYISHMDECICCMRDFDESWVSLCLWIGCMWQFFWHVLCTYKCSLPEHFSRSRWRAEIPSFCLRQLSLMSIVARAHQLLDQVIQFLWSLSWLLWGSSLKAQARRRCIYVCPPELFVCLCFFSDRVKSILNLVFVEVGNIKSWFPNSWNWHPILLNPGLQRMK